MQSPSGLVCEDSVWRHFLPLLNILLSVMVTQELALQPKIVSWMMEMVVEHSLPLEIHVQETINDLKKIILHYEAEDESMVEWVTCKCIDRYLPSL